MLGKTRLPTSPNGLLPSQQLLQEGQAHLPSWAHPPPGADQQGELTDAAAELGPQNSHPGPLHWAPGRLWRLANALDSQTFELTSGLRAAGSEEVPSPSARIAQFRRLLSSETKVPVRLGAGVGAPGSESPDPGGEPTAGKAAGSRRAQRGSGAQGAAGAQNGQAAGAGEDAGRAPRAQVGALTWLPLTCRAGRQGPRAKGREGGRRGEAAAPAAAAAVCLTLGRARPGLRDLPPPM
ncbi:uncharacterized protein LOC129557159 [Moschus berezovskii]|uniref:uncharacterized protein LOC129557159 n=1 Tax=Moschus berezovskii TaxID=68408 RepID=UPI00244397DE|nr:uncharacterized protein LOC129557159 [Moschus berezovskii]